jgi:hypothetical protein
MRPVTDALSGSTNVILALDSSGNLSVGGNASPTFSATGGQFKLSGQPLLLETNPSSNANVVIEPDGLGSIDLRGPLVNTQDAGNAIPGAVQVSDAFAILASESTLPAFIVNNDSGGDIFVASSGGTARFIVENSGDIGLQPGISIDTLTAGTLLIGNTVASTVTIGRTSNGITLPGFAGQNGVLFGANGTGELSQATTSSSGLCLTSGSASPSWSSCPGSTPTSTFWNEVGGLVYPKNTNADFAIGSQTTASANFAVLNVR